MNEHQTGAAVSDCVAIPPVFAASEHGSVENALRVVAAAAEAQRNLLIVGEQGSGRHELAEYFARLVRSGEQVFDETISCFVGDIPISLTLVPMGGFKQRLLLIDGLEEATIEVQRLLYRMLRAKQESPALYVTIANSGLAEKVRQGAIRQDLALELGDYVVCVPAIGARPKDAHRIMEAVWRNELSDEQPLPPELAAFIEDNAACVDLCDLRLVARLFARNALSAEMLRRLWTKGIADVVLSEGMTMKESAAHGQSKPERPSKPTIVGGSELSQAPPVSADIQTSVTPEPIHRNLSMRQWKRGMHVAFAPVRRAAIVQALQENGFRTVKAANSLDVTPSVVSVELRTLAKETGVIALYALPTTNLADLRARFAEGERFPRSGELSVEQFCEAVRNRDRTQEATRASRVDDEVPLVRGVKKDGRWPYFIVELVAVRQAAHRNRDNPAGACSLLGIRTRTYFRLRDRLEDYETKWRLPELVLPVLELKGLKKLHEQQYIFREIDKGRPVSSATSAPILAQTENERRSSDSRVVDLHTRQSRETSEHIQRLSEEALRRTAYGAIPLPTLKIKRLEEIAIRAALERVKNRIPRAAELLDISETELSDLLNERPVLRQPEHDLPQLPTIELLALFDRAVKAVRNTTDDLGDQLAILQLDQGDFDLLDNQLKGWQQRQDTLAIKTYRNRKYR